MGVGDVGKYGLYVCMFLCMVTFINENYGELVCFQLDCEWQFFRRSTVCCFCFVILPSCFWRLSWVEINSL